MEMNTISNAKLTSWHRGLFTYYVSQNWGFVDRRPFCTTIFDVDFLMMKWGYIHLLGLCYMALLKGILHQKIFYRLNLIFWIVMGCGIADLGRRGL